MLTDRTPTILERCEQVHAPVATKHVRWQFFAGAVVDLLLWLAILTPMFLVGRS